MFFRLGYIEIYYLRNTYPAGFQICLDLASFKCGVIPLSIVGKMEQVVKVDSKGRICIPAEIREEMGDTITIKKTQRGYLLLPGKQKDFLRRIQEINNFRATQNGQARVLASLRK